MRDNKEHLFLRYLIATIGLFLVALGIPMSVKSNLGTAALSCPPYVLSLCFGYSLGEFTILVNMLMLLLQIALLRKRFKLKYLMQILATVVFGYMIDIWSYILEPLQLTSLCARFLLIVLGSVITAIGVSLEVACEAWMLSAEMTVYALTKVTSKSFSTLKILMDSAYVVAASIACLIIYHNPLGTSEFTTLSDSLLARVPGVVIGIGTLMLAVLPGYLMKITDKYAQKWLYDILSTSRKWFNRTHQH